MKYCILKLIKAMRTLIFTVNKKRYAISLYWIIAAFIIVIAGLSITAYVIHGQERSLKSTLRPIPQNGSSFSVSPDGRTRVSGIVVVSVNNSLNNGVITATGTLKGIPVKFSITTDATTVFHIANATSSPGVVAAGQVILVTGIFNGFSPTINIAATDVRVIGLTGPPQLRLPSGGLSTTTPTVRNQATTTAKTATTTTKTTKTATTTKKAK